MTDEAIHPTRPPPNAIGARVFCLLHDYDEPSTYYTAIVEGTYAEKQPLRWDKLRTVTITKLIGKVPSRMVGGYSEGFVIVRAPEVCFETFDEARRVLVAHFQERVLRYTILRDQALGLVAP